MVGHIEHRGDLSVRPPLGDQRSDTLLRGGPRGARGWAPADAGELRPRLPRPEGSAELLEDRERLADALTSCRLLFGAALRRPEGEEGTRSLERIRNARVLYKRPLELGKSCVGIAAGGGQQTTAARRSRERRGSVEGLSLAPRASRSTPSPRPLARGRRALRSRRGRSGSCPARGRRPRGAAPAGGV